MLPVHEREKRNESVFTSVRVDTCNETKIDSGKQKEIIKRGLIVFFNLNKLETCLNDKLSCKCHVNDVVEDFIKYCYSLDNKKYAKLVGLYSKYKHIEKRHHKNKRHIS